MDRRTLLALGAVVPLAACGVRQDPLATSTSGPASGEIIVGSANFTESQVLAELYAQAMKAKGVKTKLKHGIGSREVYLKALKDGSINLIGEYSGNLLQYLEPNSPAAKADEVMAALPAAVGPELAVLPASKASNQDVYCVTGAFAEVNQVRSLGDLQKIAANSVLGGPAELQERPYGPVGLEGVYRAKFKEFRTYDSLAVKVKDLTDNKIQVATFFTTDSAITENDLVQLEDPQLMILPQQVVPLCSKKIADQAGAVAAVKGVQDQLTTEDLAALNKKVDDEHISAQVAAEGWLKSKGLA